MNRTYNVGVLLFDEAEVLDFAGPFEAFSITRLPDGSNPFSVCMVAQQNRLIKARNGLLVQPTIRFPICRRLMSFSFPAVTARSILKSIMKRFSDLFRRLRRRRRLRFPFARVRFCLHRPGF